MNKRQVWTSTTWHIRARRTKTGLLIVPVAIFGDRYDFLVDTGTVHSLISQSIADAHQLPLLQSVTWASPSGDARKAHECGCLSRSVGRVASR
jgi:hypothetical protein